MEETMAKSIYNFKSFRPQKASAEDLEKAKQLPRSACPRRHCWWWHSLSFDWDLTPAQGCTYLQSEKPPTFMNQQVPCRRADPSSIVDHYEARDPAEDGFSKDYWNSSE